MSTIIENDTANKPGYTMIHPEIIPIVEDKLKNILNATDVKINTSDDSVKQALDRFALLMSIRSIHVHEALNAGLSLGVKLINTTYHK
jgi:hypothetical protein